jgi:hypothetical protein
MRRRPITRTTWKTPSTPQLRWPVSENCRPGRSPTLTADNHHAENSDHRDRAAAEAHHRAAIPATTATETGRPIVSGGLDCERKRLRTGLRQGAGRYSQERLVPGWLARERQLLHALRVYICRRSARAGGKGATLRQARLFSGCRGAHSPASRTMRVYRAWPRRAHRFASNHLKETVRRSAWHNGAVRACSVSSTASLRVPRA